MKQSIANLVLGLGGAIASSLPIQLQTRGAPTSHLTNIYVKFDQASEGPLFFTYGLCNSKSRSESHYTIAVTESKSVSRLVWIIPDDSHDNGCISAWTNDNVLVGRSEPQKLHRVRRRNIQKRATGESSSFPCSSKADSKAGTGPILMDDDNGIDTLGPWFDGVEHLSKTGLSVLDADAAKEKQIAIVGAGMSGLMTYLVLSQAGMTNISIIEAGNRLGGRVHTEYLTGGPFDYSYQEMGPMRFPSTYKSPETNETMNITDHQLVFQLAEEMNKLNNHDKNLSVDFIPWIQSNLNGLSYKNEFKLQSGLPPTLREIASNASLSPASVNDPATKDLQTKVDTFMPGSEFSTLMAKNMFKAHKQWLETGLNGLGGDQWSEYAFMVNYLKGSLNSTDMNGGWSAASFWDSLYEGMYFSAASYKTIDGGLNRLPLSFHPLVDNITAMDRKIERVRYSETDEKVTLQWRNKYNDTTFQNSTFDYAVIAVPFSVVRRWRLPKLPATISNAIKELNYGSACKVALEFSERFWEHYENPIYGGCSTTTDIPGIGSICYPSYNLNGTGPATILASYISGDMGVRLASMSEKDHVQMVVDAMVEIHGEFTRDLFTGKYNRRCWALDPLQSGSWASPTAGQHQLYIPEYFKTCNKARIASILARHSLTIRIDDLCWRAYIVYSRLDRLGFRLGYSWRSPAFTRYQLTNIVQPFTVANRSVELGLVDEAKHAVEKWMARWIEVVRPFDLVERSIADLSGYSKRHLTLLRDYRRSSETSGITDDKILVYLCQCVC
jgi:monoamine oxidase